MHFTPSFHVWSGLVCITKDLHHGLTSPPCHRSACGTHTSSLLTEKGGNWLTKLLYHPPLWGSGKVWLPINYMPGMPSIQLCERAHSFPAEQGVVLAPFSLSSWKSIALLMLREFFHVLAWCECFLSRGLWSSSGTEKTLTSCSCRREAELQEEIKANKAHKTNLGIPVTLHLHQWETSTHEN